MACRALSPSARPAPPLCDAAASVCGGLGRAEAHTHAGVGAGSSVVLSGWAGARPYFFFFCRPCRAGGGASTCSGGRRWRFPSSLNRCIFLYCKRACRGVSGVPLPTPTGCTTVLEGRSRRSVVLSRPLPGPGPSWSRHPQCSWCSPSGTGTPDHTDRAAVTHTGALWPLSAPGGCAWPPLCAGAAPPCGEAEPSRLRRTRRPPRPRSRSAHRPCPTSWPGLVGWVGVALAGCTAAALCSESLRGSPPYHEHLGGTAKPATPLRRCSTCCGREGPVLTLHAAADPNAPTHHEACSLSVVARPRIPHDDQRWPTCYREYPS